MPNNEHELYMVRDGMYLDENVHVKESWGSANTGEPKEINVHQIPDVELIWDNKGIESEKPISIWKTQQIQGYFNPGHIAVYGHTSPGVGFLLKGLRSNLTGEYDYLVTLSMATFEKMGLMNFSGSDLYWVKMSEFYSEMQISPIRAFLITLRSPAARIFFKKILNIKITSEYYNSL